MTNGPGRGRKLSLLELSDREIQRTVERPGEVIGRDPVAQQHLEIAQLVVSFLSDRDLSAKR